MRFKLSHYKTISAIVVFATVVSFIYYQNSIVFAADLNVTSGTTVLDTDANPSGFNYDSLYIAPGATLTAVGASPLILNITGTVDIQGTLDVSGGNGTNSVSCVGNAGGVGIAGGGDGGDGKTGGEGSGLNGTGSGAGIGGYMGGFGSPGDVGAGGGGASYQTFGITGVANGRNGYNQGAGYGFISSTLSFAGSGGGGGASDSDGTPCAGGGGGAGGGAVIVNGASISVTGSILADGGDGGTYTASAGAESSGGGGGSGGLIVLNGSTISGNGTLSVAGGIGGLSNTYNTHGGNGGEGWIILEYDSSVSFSGTTTNDYYKILGTDSGDITVASNDTVYLDSDILSTYEFNSLTISSSGTLSAVGSSAITITVVNTLLVNGTIDVSGGSSPYFENYFVKPSPSKGYLGGGDGGVITLVEQSPGGDGEGLGAGLGGVFCNSTGDVFTGGSGGGYGSVGGKGEIVHSGSCNTATIGPEGGPTYGDVELTNLYGGSGGGSGGTDGPAVVADDLSLGQNGGSGGGAIKINADSITINGSIQADGGDGTDKSAVNNAESGSGGGGSGGSIWINAGTITNNGSISAVGGLGGISSAYGNNGGDGGDGRIRLDYDTLTGAGSVLPTPGYTSTYVGPPVEYAKQLTTYNYQQYTTGTGSSSVYNYGSTTADSSDNIINVGRFSGTVDFDKTQSLAYDKKTSIGTGDGYIAKYNEYMQLTWVKNVKSAVIGDVAVDSNDNIYIIGYANGSSIDFDLENVVSGDTISTTTNNAFIAKYNSNGVLIWLKHINDTSQNEGHFINIDNYDNIYAQFRASLSSTDFDPDNVVSGDTLETLGNWDVVFAKYNSSGVIQWAKALGNSEINTPRGIAVDDNGNLVVLGEAIGIIDFDLDNVISGDTVDNTGQNDGFAAYYNTNGVFQWVKIIGQTALNDSTFAADFSSTGDLYLTGTFRGGADVDFDRDNVVTGDTLSKGGIDSDVYFAKFNTNGVLQWVKGVGNSVYETPYEVVVDGDNNVYFLMNSRGVLDFDPNNVTLQDTISGHLSYYTPTYVSYDSNGNFRFANTVSTETAAAFDMGLTYLSSDHLIVSFDTQSTSIDVDNFSVDSSDNITKSSLRENIMIKHKIYSLTKIENLDAGLLVEDVISASDATEYSPSFYGDSREMYLETSTNIPIARVNVNMLFNRDWTSVTADSDLANGKSVVANLTSAPGTANSHSLYVPNNGGKNGVRICPNALVLADVYAGCPGEYFVGVQDNSVSEVNIGGQDYFLVSGLSGTGGEGIVFTPMQIVLRDSELTSQSSDVEVWFDTGLDIIANTTIYITYDDAFTGGSAITTSDITATCDTDGDDPLTGTGLTAVTVVDSQNGYLELNTNTDVCTEWMVIDINGTGGNQLTNPDTSGNYSWAIDYDLGTTGTIDQSGATLAYVQDENDVLVTASVAPVINMTIYEAGVDNPLGGTGANTCELAILSINAINTCSYDLGTGTNNPSGISVFITSDGALRTGLGDEISACSGTNCNGDGTAGVTIGSEEYGMYISDLGGGHYTAANSFNIQHQLVPQTPTLFASSATTGSGTTEGNLSQRLEITHAGAISVDTGAGSYSHVVTYTVFSN